MSNSLHSSLPPDVCLLLRADAEQCWLRREVIPVLRQLETREQLPDEQVEAALAYLEVMWNEAKARARETDAAHAHLDAEDGGRDELSGPAGRYHAAVRVLRGVVAERVTPFVEPPIEIDGDRAEAAPSVLRVADACRPSAGGCTPRAA